MRNGRLALLALGVLPLVLAACTRSIDLKQALEITDASSGWYDVGVVDGKNKLVPSVSFKLQNVSAEPIENVQINAIFRRVDEPEGWGERLVRGVGDEGLEPGATGRTLVVRSERGYTGSEPRLQMLKNSAFVDARVELFGKHGSRTWVKIGEFPIDRDLITE